jgi:hypothetical protein
VKSDSQSQTSKWHPVLVITSEKSVFVELNLTVVWNKFFAIEPNDCFSFLYHANIFNNTIFMLLIKPENTVFINSIVFKNITFMVKYTKLPDGNEFNVISLLRSISVETRKKILNFLIKYLQ